MRDRACVRIIQPDIAVQHLGRAQDSALFAAIQVVFQMRSAAGRQLGTAISRRFALTSVMMIVRLSSISRRTERREQVIRRNARRIDQTFA